jgi:hypothetical protein
MAAMMLHRLILAVLFAGLFGMGAELLLLQHTGNVCENTAGPGTGRHDSAGTARACIHLPTPV